MRTKTLLKLSAFMDVAEIDFSVLKGTDKTVVGIAIIAELAKKIHRAENEFYEMVMDYKKITREEAEEIDIVEVVKEILTDGDVQSFLS